MAEVTARRGQVFAISPSQATEWLRVHPEIVLLSALMLVAAVLRFVGLDDRTIHHDESLHTQYSWYLAEGRAYVHDPLMHGPFKFITNSGVYFLLGDSDFTSRLLPVLFGSALVGMPYFLRNQIGMKAVLIAAVLITFSPTLLYVSRFSRDDIYITVWMLGMVIAAWRYLAEPKAVYLYVFAALLSLSFATMEITFILAAIMLLYFNGMLAIELAARRPGESISSRGVFTRTLILMPFAWLLAAIWPLLSRNPYGHTNLPKVGDLLLVLGTLTLPQFAAGVQVLPFVGDAGYRAASESELTVMTVLVLILASAYAGIQWHSRTWLIAAAFFYVPYVLLFTTFFTNQPPVWSGDFWLAEGGFWSGIWGSLDYWLAQHDVNRGSQPVYYYTLMTPLYEFLPMLIALAGGVWLALRGDSLQRLLLFWAAGIFVGLSIAGEKMPWLEVHIALPLCLVAAVILARLSDKLAIDGGRALSVLAQALPFAAGVLLIIDAGSNDAQRYVGWLLAGGSLLFSLGTGFLSGEVRRSALALSLALLVGLSLRTAYTTAYENDNAEMMVYAQAGQDLAVLMDRIEVLADESGLGYNLPVVVDVDQTWPWAWYLRNYHQVSFINLANQNYTPPAGAVVIANSSHAGSVNSAGYNQVPHRHYYWFPQHYLGLTLSKTASILTSSDGLQSLSHYFLYRWPDSEYTTQDGVAFFPASLSVYDPTQKQVIPAPEPQLLSDGRTIIGAPGNGPGHFSQPADLTTDRDGNVWVVDSRNHRVQKYDSSGNFLLSFGGNGSGPGIFNEPWGIVIDDSGFVYVADTWNHRIQKFTQDGVFVTTWGEPATMPNPGLLDLFGPRDLVIDAEGTLWITDTGGKRLLRFSTTGEPLGSYGSGGTGTGQFAEPVGLAIDTSGRIYVADTWNARIQRFESDFSNAMAFQTSWSSQDILAKPYLTILSDGRIVASDPGRGELLLLKADGTKVGVWSPGTASLPLGVTALADGGFAFSDGRLNQVQLVPLGMINQLFQ